VALIAVACQGAHALAPGASLVGAALAAAEAAGASAPPSASRTAVAALRAALAPALGAGLGARALLGCAVALAAAAVGAAAVARRLLVAGESPPLLLLAVIAPALLATFDYAAAAPHAHAWAPATLLAAGLALYAAKLPERLFAPPLAQALAPPAAQPRRRGRSPSPSAARRAAPPSLPPPPPPGFGMRVVDFVGHSHMLHHLCYSASLTIMAAGYAGALARGACAGAAAGDPACVAVR
jgi:hypothetical protein